MHLYKFCQCVQWFGIVGPEFMFQHVPAIAFTLAKNIPISIDSNGDKLEWRHPRSHRFSREIWVELLSWVCWRAEYDVMWLHIVHFAQGVRECCYPACSSSYKDDMWFHFRGSQSWWLSPQESYRSTKSMQGVVLQHPEFETIQLGLRWLRYYWGGTLMICLSDWHDWKHICEQFDGFWRW